MAGLAVNTPWSSGEATSSSSSASASKMNAEAKAFVPQSQLNPSASVFVPMAASTSAAPMAPRNMATNTSQWAQKQSDPVSMCEECVHVVCADPQNLDTVALYMVNNLNQTVFDHFTLESVVSYLIECTLSLPPPFPFLSASLCVYLEANLSLDFPECPSSQNFRSSLLSACRTEHANHKVVLTTKAQRVRNFALFMAHLYTSLTVGQSGKQQRIKALAKAVVELSNTLLSINDALAEDDIHNNINIGCQVLKIAGEALEKDIGIGQDAAIFASLFDTIRGLLTNEDYRLRLTDQNRLSLQSVLDARSSGWVGVFMTGNDDASYEDARWASSGNPDLTSEEIRFINEQLGSDTDETTSSILNNSSRNDEDDDSNQMDPEIEAAFEEFLAGQS